MCKHTFVAFLLSRTFFLNGGNGCNGWQSELIIDPADERPASYSEPQQIYFAAAGWAPQQQIYFRCKECFLQAHVGASAGRHFEVPLHRPAMRPRTLREEVALARSFEFEGWNPRIISEAYQPIVQPADLVENAVLREGFVVDDVPRDLLVHILSLAHSIIDIAHVDAVCHAFHSCSAGESSSVVADALRLRAIDAGPEAIAAAAEASAAADAVDAASGRYFSTATTLMRAERMRMLASELRTRGDGMRLALSCDTNTGYFGVVCHPWKKPYAYIAESHDGVRLGAFPTAMAAAIAVGQYLWVQRNPCL